jgi:predicted pyridoxine 5'-phosphate oxidase superfamily flavin-nucleotide-binding protein
MTILYHDGNRRLQDQFDSRRIADRLEQVTTRTAFTDADKTFIESQCFFFLATATAEGHPTCNLKGGNAGFVRVAAPDELVFPDYDGNGMFLSIGNISANPNIGLLFIDFEKQKRLRVNGTAHVSREDPLIKHTVGAQLIVRVEVHAIFPNCPRGASRVTPWAFEAPLPSTRSYFRYFTSPVVGLTLPILTNRFGALTV